MRALITNTGGGSDRVCLHVHGIYSKPESIVLCETDYSRRYVESLTAQRKLFALLATQRIAFFGFSLNDPAFLEILRVCRATLGGGDPRHFAVLPLEGERAAAKTALRHYEEFAKIVMSLVHRTAEERMLENTDPHKNEFGKRRRACDRDAGALSSYRALSAAGLYQADSRRSLFGPC